MAFTVLNSTPKTKPRNRCPRDIVSIKFQGFTGIYHTNLLFSKYKYLEAPMPPFCETAFTLHMSLINMLTKCFMIRT